MQLRVLAIDVWGNAKDGYELNDWHDSGIRLEVDEELNDAAIIKLIRKACGHRADARGYVLEITESTCNVYAKDGKPCYCCDIVTESKITQFDREFDRDVRKRLDAQEGHLLCVINLSEQDIKDNIFRDNDVVERCLLDHELSADDVCLEHYRDLQFMMIANIIDAWTTFKAGANKT